MREKHLPVAAPEGCQWVFERWYSDVGGLYLVETVRPIQKSSVFGLYYFLIPLPPSIKKDDGTFAHSIGDKCISSFGYREIERPEDTRAASKRLVRAFRKFVRVRERERAAQAARLRMESERAGALARD